MTEARPFASLLCGQGEPCEVKQAWLLEKAVQQLVQKLVKAEQRSVCQEKAALQVWEQLVQQVEQLLKKLVP